jgi:endoglucanase
MKKLLYVLMAAIFVFAGCSCATPINPDASQTMQTTKQPAETPAVVKATPQPQDDNMVINGDFSEGESKWSTFLTSGGSADFTVENDEAVVDITSCGMNDYSIQLYYDGFKLETGGVYTFAFDARSDIERRISARLQLNGGDYTGYAEGDFDLNGEMKTFKVDFTMEQGTDPAPRLVFNLGTPKGSESPPKNRVYIDNVEVRLTDGSEIVKPEPEPERPDININQIGYRPGDKKIAVLRDESLGDTFQVIAADGSAAFEGNLSGPVLSAPSGETNYTADFTGLTAEGVYTIKCGEAQSYEFEIAEGVYDDAFKAIFKMLYLQRCGSELPEEYAGDFAHDACHTGKAVIYGTDKKKDVSGGWHDAGDYGRYVVSGAKTVADLLFAYQDYPEALKADDLGIPESGNEVPDILDEARYELEWMLKMQDENGGVYHKVTCLAFPGFVMPTEETDQLYIMPVSLTATGDFTAVMAMSYNIFKDFDSKFAVKCLKAAEKAWGYLEENHGPGFKNPEDVKTGEYGDGGDADERYWAAAALYSATGDKKYLEAFERALWLYIYVLDGYGWSSVGGYGNKIYLSLDSSVTNPEYVRKIKDYIKMTADKYLNNAKADGYGMSLGNSYPWGSNMTVCDNANFLIYASKLLGNAEYAAAADRHLNYIFGTNPMSICYVTGFGTVSPLHTHHRPSLALEIEMPGMLAGGPDSNLEDPFAKAVLQDTPPAKCYVDNDQSFSTNEITIYWNSPLIYLMAHHMSS